jgi:hypothetical protein
VSYRYKIGSPACTATDGEVVFHLSALAEWLKDETIFKPWLKDETIFEPWLKDES